MISLKVEPVVDLATPLVGWPSYYSVVLRTLLQTTYSTKYSIVLLNKYAYDTQNLLAIVDSALHGKLHTSVLNTQRWLTELREVKANIPIGTTLPLEIKEESISDFMNISEITVCHKGRLTIITACNIHTDKTLLLPSNHIRANTYADLIPENPKLNVKHSFTKSLNSFIPQSIVNVQIIKDLTEFTHRLQELNT
ncbi:hypothetical protein ACI65C_006828 [Semiaphis heraclei]